MTRATFAVLGLSLTLLGAAAGCGGDAGGCGAPPDDSRQPAPSSSGGGGPTGGGSGSVAINRWDSAKKAPAAPPAAAAAAPAASASLLEGVGAGEWKPKVLDTASPVLVLAAKAPCKDCDLLAAAIKGVSPIFPRLKIYRLDLGQPGASALLPAPLNAAEPPSMALYKGGAPASRRQGMPFPRDKDEADATYTLRLSRWLRDALAQSDLSLGKR